MGSPVCSPVCAATQNSEKFENITQALPSVHRMAGPIKCFRGIIIVNSSLRLRYQGPMLKKVNKSFIKP